MSQPITNILGLMIPIIAIVMGIGLAMVGLWFSYRLRRDVAQMHHAERLAAIEKGIELPPLPPEFYQQGRSGKFRNPSTNLRRGLILLAVGTGVALAMHGTNDDAWWWGLVPAAIGLAYLGIYAIEGRIPPGAPLPRSPDSDTRPPL